MTALTIALTVTTALAVLCWRQARRIGRLNARIRQQNQAVMDRAATHAIEIRRLADELAQARRAS